MKAYTIDSLPRLAALCALAISAVSPALAASINYGDFNDFPAGVVEYQDVTESSATDAVPLFGAPDVDVNKLDFDPQSFGSSASNGDLEITDGQLNFSFATLPGTGIDSLEISEGGDFTIVGGSGSTTVNSGIYANVLVTAVNGIALAPADQFEVEGSTSASFNSVGLSQPWNLGLLLEFGPALSLNGFAAGSLVTAGDFVLNNTLVAASEPGSLAFIAKKDFNITPDGSLDPDNVIPEPTAAALAALALVGLARRR
ncbi:hypothetical protein [Botrimarina mediterranea]|uniref:PEP-CTERM protein-sorting domain-containing protein n=1 Tax=Botrimarina mediterranea TaxID=2528022 RepID=A0A518K3K4_9BACT|nr:hypothetical protein [Botrimarina mediterranea]QDV72383.1 hypothetical protein Spa11_05580 [Botrimarina mediterranea]QDV76929.1 hypothetical protein K2D_05130 [Planctomycetes bacterium K2D]